MMVLRDVVTQLLLNSGVTESRRRALQLPFMCDCFARPHTRSPMPFRPLAAAELGEFLNAIAHPRRIQIIEELRGGEKDVNTLCQIIHTSHSNTSQHLSVLRARRVVAERREGRRVLYRLCSLELADWLLLGMDFVSAVAIDSSDVTTALRRAAATWRDSGRYPTGT